MIYLAADHRGYQLKERIKEWLKEWRYEFQDMGAFEYNQDDDYPDFVHRAAQKVSENPEQDKAIILGGSGQGEAMVANRYKGIRAAVFYGPSFETGAPKSWRWESWLLVLGGGGSLGVAEGIIYEKFKEIIKMSREHNNSNVLSLGASFLHEKTAKGLIKLWFETSFSNEERHKRRIEKIDRS
ncbi:MAG: RpiB/LacA/LacB family sugar-phosphate isomerase [Patescibacteria group bacterium]